MVTWLFIQEILYVIILIRLLDLSFDVHDVVVGGRLATSVKKNLVLMGYDQEADKTHQEVNEDVISDLFDESVLLTFSIEWAGFG